MHVQQRDKDRAQRLRTLVAGGAGLALLLGVAVSSAALDAHLELREARRKAGAGPLDAAAVEAVAAARFARTEQLKRDLRAWRDAPREARAGVRLCFFLRKRRTPRLRSFEQALADGLKAHGFTTVQLSQDPTLRWEHGDRNRRRLRAWFSAKAKACDAGLRYAVSYEMRDAFAEQGKHVVVLELPYVRGMPEDHYSVMFDGLNGYGLNSFAPGAPADRWDAVFAPRVSLRPWADNPDGDTLVVGQLKKDKSMEPVKHRFGSAVAWYAWAVAGAREAVPGRRVSFRPHPKDLTFWSLRWGEQFGSATLRRGGTLGAALSHAAAVVTMNSNTGVDAVLAGVPVVATDPGSMVWPITSHFVSDVASPRLATDAERAEWAHSLAYTQWSIPELRAGAPWEFLLNVFPDLPTPR